MFVNRICSPLLRMSSRLFLEKASVKFQSSAAETQSKDLPSFKTLALSVPKPFVYHVELNRPDKLNAMNNDMWLEIGDCFSLLGDDENCRVVLLSARGRAFTSGLDFSSMMRIAEKLSEHEDVARRCKILKGMIETYQKSITSLEKCPKPVIGLIHGMCIGGGVDLVCTADIRCCTEDSVFQVKEVDIGMAADVGTLQRLPRAIGSASLVNELCFTARQMLPPEAKDCGFVSRVFKDQKSMIASGLEMAECIAAKSPVAVQLTKRSLIFSRDHSVQEGLDHIATWNMTMLQCEDFINATTAIATKSPPPTFAKL